MIRFAQTAGFAAAFLLLGAVAATIVSSQPAARAQDNDNQDNDNKAPLRHVVLFKFKDDATKEQVDEIVREFGKLPEKIDGISGYEWGTDVSPEGLSQGFTHCFVVTFPDAKARDAYLPHPAHKEFVELLRPRLDKVLVVDYFVKK